MQHLWLMLLPRPEIHAQVALALEGSLLRVREVSGSEEMLGEVWQHAPDVLLVESAPPHDPTISFCQRLRLFFHFPILVIEQGASEHERIAMLDSGADDVVAVVAGLADLRARVFALVRRHERERRRNPLSGSALQAPGMRLDIRGRRLLLPDNQIDLTLLQTKLLALLFNCQGDIVSYDLLAEHMFSQVTPATIARVTVIADLLRRRLLNDPRLPPVIEKIRGSGYRLAFAAASPAAQNKGEQEGVTPS